MDRALLFLGRSGAGKSTLINTLIGEVKSKVSHRKMVDGTSSVVDFSRSSDPGLLFIDTPGLDSDNFITCVTEKVQNEYLHRKICIILVISKQEPRITKFLSDFERIYSNLIGDGRPFGIVWTREGNVEEEDRRHLMCRFPHAIMCTDVSQFRTLFIDNQANFFTLKVKEAPLRAQSIAAAKPKAKALKADAVPKAKDIVPTIGFPTMLDNINGFKIKPDNKGKLDQRLDEVLNMKLIGGEQYQLLRFIGDANLKSQVLNILFVQRAKSELRELSFRITNEKYTLNDVEKDGAMILFFDEYIADKHRKLFPQEQVSSHGKADVVEALLEHARASRDSHAFKYMVKELFRLVDIPIL